MPDNDFMNKALERDENTIRDMFSRAAPRYDFLNHLLSLNFDKKWRRILVAKSRFADFGNDVRILDLCTGTGDVIFEFFRNPNFKGTAVGIDFSEPMLEIAKEKASKLGVKERVEFLNANALEIPFSENSFDIVTISFGLRNLSNLDKGLMEFHRVLKPKGRFLSLEFFKPKDDIAKTVSSWYVSYVIPFLGRLVTGRKGAYDYLPASRGLFVRADEFDNKLASIGFTKITHMNFIFKVTTLHYGEKT